MAEANSQKVLLKDQLFHRSNVTRIANEIASVSPPFEVDRFVARVTDAFPALELKQRIGWIAECLWDELEGDAHGMRSVVEVLLAALPEPCDPTLSDGDFGDFIYAPYSRLVALHGCTRKDLAFSLEAMKEITTRFSAEDGIRPFINAFPTETFSALEQWCSDSHYHVRRLCSEGTRPLLPWAGRLVTPPQHALPILHALHADTTRFVTRSVSNHVNDLAKIDADLAVDVLLEWQRVGLQQAKELDWMVRHASRTLIKTGNARALQLAGVDMSTPVQVANADWSSAVVLGDALQFSFDIVAERDCDLVVDYVIHFASPPRSGGDTKRGTGAAPRMGRKVYKLGRVTATGGCPVRFEKDHVLRAGMTTRRIVPGTHRLEVQVNGQLFPLGSFEVLESP